MCASSSWSDHWLSPCPALTRGPSSASLAEASSRRSASACRSWSSISSRNCSTSARVNAVLSIFTSAPNLVENRTMCYSDDARVPLPPISGAAANQGDLVLTSSDGTKFAAYFARAEKPTGAGMVVMPDVRGLHNFYKELAQRFAEAGIDAVAIDYFGRTAGMGDRDESFDYKPHVEKTTPEGIAADVAAAVAHLKSKDGGTVKSVFTVGFCFGGSNSWNQSALTHGVDGCIGFYGRPERSLPFISKMKAPLLLLIAGADAATPREAFVDFDRTLTEAKVPHEMQIYEGAPHSFFDRTFAEWKDACDDAWGRILAFVKKHG